MHLEYKAENYMEAIIILSEITAFPFKMTKRLTALHCDLFGKCLSQLVCQLLIIKTYHNCQVNIERMIKLKKVS